MFLKQNVGPNPVEGPKTGITLQLFKLGFRSNGLHALIKKKITMQENSLKWTRKQMQRVHLIMLILDKYDLITV
ncbi:hypothetical protein PVAP13_2NG452903 [Panicum virgatum]|uniref:Uncharacterized protein n=1 Tax=Panicum virgatum TaxID=38727 RepID=A0A8T0VMM2_PANVG|nr:hypothetical protein PVAP13_2NG452903 [Panicum virgatum]